MDFKNTLQFHRRQMAMDADSVRVGIFHYWLVALRGGEKVLAEILKLYPHADLWCHVSRHEVCRDINYDPERLRSTALSRIPAIVKSYKLFSPLCYVASLLVPSTQYDLLISSESGPIKGLRKNKAAVHVCYCHSPFRILWVPLDWYGEKVGVWKYLLALLRWPLRVADRLSARSVDMFVANSNYIRQRIERVYDRDSIVVHPPVDVDRFAVAEEKGDYFLWLGELVAYKRPDLVVAACSASGVPLLVAGQGEMQTQLQANAGPNVKFLGRVSDEALPGLLARARALLFAGVEDFGIVFVEALASGTPVVALAEGGVVDIVSDMESGVLFEEQSVGGLQEGLQRFMAVEHQFEPARLRQLAHNFSPDRFRTELLKVVNRELEKKGLAYD